MLVLLPRRAEGVISVEIFPVEGFGGMGRGRVEIMDGDGPGGAMVGSTEVEAGFGGMGRSTEVEAGKGTVEVVMGDFLVGDLFDLDTVVHESSSLKSTNNIYKSNENGMNL